MTNVLTEPFDGTPGGMNLALPQQELDDTEARYIQDGLLDYPGLNRMRGPVKPAAGFASFTDKGTGLIAALNPLGQPRYATLTGTASTGALEVLSDDGSSKVSLAWPFALPGTTPYHIVDAKPALGGGVLIGVSSAYDADSVNQGLALWYGGNKANATKTITVARGSTAVTGSGFSGSVVPGMFLFSNTDDPYTNAYVGVVLQVNSDTSLTLTKPSPYAATAKSATFQSIRGIAPKVVEGRITADTTSTAVTGGNTKFLSQGLNVGTWQLYRQSDGAFIGKVSSVSSEFALTLTANAAVAVSNESYMAIRADADFSIINTSNVNKVGFLNAVYADRQWYGNRGSSFDTTTEVTFSDTDDLEALDLSTFDGNKLSITSSSTVNEPLRAMAPAHNGLLLFKENETFIITGTSPSEFTVRKLEDDGALSGMSVQQYAGGVIWAGREGIHFYDGIQTENLTARKLGDYWKNTIRTFDSGQYRMWSMVNRDHYMLFIESIDPVLGITKGTHTTIPTKYTVTINLATRAITFLTGVDIRGAVTVPAEVGRRTLYLVNGRVSGDSSDHAIICDGEAIFNVEGEIDTVLPVGSSTYGPDWFFESKKFDGGISTRLKRFKHLIMHYLIQGGDLNVDVVLGLNNLGTTLSSTFPESVYTWTRLAQSVSTWSGLADQFPTWSSLVTAVFTPKRVKFGNKRSQHLSFRLWHEPGVTRLRTGPFEIGYKVERPGRV